MKLVRLAGAALGVVLAFIALIEPRLVRLGAMAVIVALIGLALAIRRGESRMPHAIALLLTSFFALTAWSEPRWCCDATPYYIYLRSAAFDHDLDFANDWANFGLRPPGATPTGRAGNAHSIGPSLLWAPFVFLAHLYVLTVNALGLGTYTATGLSAPYLLATAAGTNVAVVAGIVVLWRTCARRFSMGVGGLALVFGLLSSTLPYYVFVAPSVAHGAVFSASALFVMVWSKVEKNPTWPGWMILAGLLGVVSLFRWQAVVLGLMFVPLFFDAFRRRISRWWWAPASVLVSALVFSPQLAVWWVLFGSPTAAPTQFHGMDWASPHFIDVLLSADRGLFTWTPAMALGCLGWVVLARTWPSFAGSALAVFVATTWVNGGVDNWAGADAFGARRFDLLIPLWVLGLCAVIETLAAWVAQRPLLAPGAAFAFFALWNIGLIRLHRNGVFETVAPFEEVAARQAATVRRVSEDWLGRIAGASGRNFAYRAFVGRYFYLNIGFDGRIDLSLPATPYLSGGWSERTERPDFGAFRFAGPTGACVKVPFERPLDLRVVVSARSLVDDQVMTLNANGKRVSGASLPLEWTDVRFDVPALLLNSGENTLCLAFSRTRPNERAAAVRLIQLP